MSKLNGKVALVTGAGAMKGIGRASVLKQASDEASMITGQSYSVNGGALM